MKKWWFSSSQHVNVYQRVTPQPLNLDHHFEWLVDPQGIILFVMAESMGVKWGVKYRKHLLMNHNYVFLFFLNPLYVYLKLFKWELLCLVGGPEITMSHYELACHARNRPCLVGRKSAWRCPFSSWGIPSRHHGCFDTSRHGHPWRFGWWLGVAACFRKPPWLWSCKVDGPIVMWMLVYNPHEYYRYNPHSSTQTWNWTYKRNLAFTNWGTTVSWVFWAIQTWGFHGSFIGDSWEGFFKVGSLCHFCQGR